MMNKNSQSNNILNVLSVEDSIKDYDLICGQLTDAGYDLNITRIEREEEFKDLISRNKYDIILADFKLPAFDAFVALRLCNEICPDIPFICVSGSIGEETVIELIKQGAIDYVLKDKPKRLPFAVKRALDETKERKARKLAEESLRESEERFRLIFENSIDGLFLAAPDGTILSVNQAGSRMYGRSKEEILKLGRNGILDTSEIRFEEGLVTRKQTGFFCGELTGIKSDGRKFPVEVSSFVFTDHNNIKRTSTLMRDITDRKRAEMELRRAHDRIRGFIDANIVGVIIATPSDGIIEANDYYLHMIGYTREEFRQGKINWRTITPPEWLPADERALQELHERGVCTPYEKEYIRRDGTRVSVYLSDTMLPGGMDEIAAFAIDITKRKNAEEKIKKLNRTYAVLSEINKAIVRIDEQQKLFEEICRIAVETGEFAFCWIGIADAEHDCIRPAAQYGFSDRYLETIKISLSANKEEGRGPTGTAVRECAYNICNNIENDERMLPWRDVTLKQGFRSSSAFPLVISGRTYGVIVFYSCRIDFFDDEEIRLLEELSSDISYCIGMLNKEKQRQQAEKERDRFFNNSIDMMCIGGFDGYFKQLNPAWEKTLGWTNEELMSKPLTEYIHPDDLNDTRKLTEDAIIRGEAKTNILNRFLCKDGTYKWLLWNSITIKDEKLVFAVTRDITEIIKKDIERKNLEAQLVKAQKLESLGTMAGGIAHDFNNILNIIIGYASFIKSEDHDINDLKKDAEIILDASKRGAGLVKQLLTFARKSESVFQSVQVNDIINEIKVLLKETFLKTIEINCELQENLPPVIGDSTQIHQIFLNLCVNARDAMQNRGQITITTRHLDCETVKIQKPDIDPGHYIEIQVRDNGTGIDEAIRQKIFDPFFTTKETGKGTGLGLALVYGIVKSHGGFIDLASEVGKGSTFYIYLPAQTFSEDIFKEIKQTEEDLPQGTGTILIIEDEKQTSELLTTLLVLKGYKVIAAYDGLQGIAAYQNHKNEIAAVISDMGLPKLGGEEVYKHLKAMNPKIKVILISGFIDPEVKARLQEEGVRYFVQKPYVPADILRTLKNVIEEKR